MEVFWYFIAYSFLGFLLEVAFARLTGAAKRDRKCFMLLPLCPVYGLGALAILSLPRPVMENGLLLILVGGAAATAVEYVMAAFYEKILGVSFWDYSGLPGNISGRVSLPFSVAWGLLGAVLVRCIHPLMTVVFERVPLSLTWGAAVILVGDGLYTAALLHRTRNTDSLRWYTGQQKDTAG